MEEDTVGWRPDPLVGASMFFRGLQSPEESFCPWWGWGVCSPPCLPSGAAYPGPPPRLCLTPCLWVSHPPAFPALCTAPQGDWVQVDLPPPLSLPAR